MNKNLCIIHFLQEADNWTTLSADMEEVFQSKDIDKVSALHNYFVFLGSKTFLSNAYRYLLVNAFKHYVVNNIQSKC